MTHRIDMEQPCQRPHILTIDDLDDYGLTPADVKGYPGATEYRALDGSPCWLADDLTELLGDGGES